MLLRGEEVERVEVPVGSPSAEPIATDAGAPAIEHVDPAAGTDLADAAPGFDPHAAGAGLEPAGHRRGLLGRLRR